MNERMKELLSQAGVHYEVLPKDTVYEKFAGLIVKECAYAIDQHNTKSYQVSQPFSIEQILTKHFGVEQ
jgi:hypothetical protein